MLLILYAIFDGINGPDNFWELTVILLVAGIFTIPTLLILLNHYKYSKETILEIVNKTVTIHSGDESETFNFDEIKNITEYHAYKGTPFGVLEYWRIETITHIFYISGLVISKSDFDRFFWNKIEEKTKVWPKMHSKAIEPIKGKAENISERTSE